MSSEVLLCEEIATNNQVAIKLFKKHYLHGKFNRDDEIAAFVNEVTILESFEHRNIVKIYEYGYDGTLSRDDNEAITSLNYIIMEYIPHTLFDFCLCMGSMGEDAGRYFFNQLIDVVDYIHKQGVAHRDIKLENIGIDNELKIKLLDFGLASQRNIDNLTDSVGSRQYMAPEVHQNEAHSGEIADFFSVGVILFQIVTGHSPFESA